MRNHLAAWITQQWYRVGVWHIFLVPLSWLFWLLSSLRRKAYSIGLFGSYRAPVPLIVVGNISVGGTGKTPFVIWLVTQLKAAGFKPGVVSRGYGGSHAVAMAVEFCSPASLVGDEPVLIQQRAACPVWVGVDRVAAINGLLSANPACDVIVSDDGLQHYRVQRDIELVLVDAEREFGNRLLLPAGPLREPISRLTEVDAVIYNGASGLTDVMRMQLKPGHAVNLKDSTKIESIETWRGAVVHAVAGIGNPERFFQLLRDMLLNIEAKAFSDHHAYVEEDFSNMGKSLVLMTEKDAVKCRAFAKPNWWYLPVEAVLDEALFVRILQKLRK